MKYKTSDFTIEEKIKMLAGKDRWHTEDLNGKLYCVTVADGPLGLRKSTVNENIMSFDLPAVAYPSSEVLAQTWNLSLAREMGECLADECIENDVDILLAPGVNIKRDPLCGRNFEYFSEDPYVAGTFAREYINGVQSKHVGTSLKHYCANNLEVGRVWTSSEVDERTLREIYLEPFRIACEANPTTVMCSYNLVNGQRMSEHVKLYRILREEFWREDGLIISDWNAVKDHAASVRAGLDIEMPYSEAGYVNLKQAYEKGELSEEEIDACVERVLRFIDHCEKEKKKAKVSTTKRDRIDLAQKIAEEGTVLLKNEGTLPIADGKSVFVASENGGYICGGGSSCVQPIEQPESLCNALKAALPSSEVTSGTIIGDSYLSAFEGSYGKDVAVVECSALRWEGDDVSTIKLSSKEERLILETARRNPNTVVVLRCGGAVDMSAWIDKVSAVIYAGYGGIRGNEAVAAILSGKVNPSGKIAETFAWHAEDYPSASCYRTHNVNLYSDGLFVGYRYFDGVPQKVLFPFGYGLSFSEFEYSSLTVQEENDGVSVQFCIKNNSDRDGAETAQVYIREENSRVFRPYKELKAFKKVFLRAGEEKMVTIELKRDAFMYYSVAKDCWTSDAGWYQILIGSNAADIRLKSMVLFPKIAF